MNPNLHELSKLITPAIDGEPVPHIRTATVTTSSPLTVLMDDSLVPATSMVGTLPAGAIVTMLTVTNAPPLVIGSNLRGPWATSWGVVPGGYGEKTANESGFGTSGVIANLVATFDMVAGRFYRTIMHLTSCGSTAICLMTANITDATGTIPVGGVIDRLDVANGQAPLTVVSKLELAAVSATGVVRRGTFGVSAGSGSITASATQPCTITVEDMGPG